MLARGVNFDINGESSSFKFRPRLEVCNMIGVKNMPSHDHVVKEEPRKEEGLKKKKRKLRKKNVKEIKEEVASVKTKEQKPPVETKNKPENKPVPKMVRKWVPKIATPTKSVDPE